jgi:DNA polymerase-1
VRVKHLIIDVNNLLMRGFHVNKKSKTTDGKNTGGIETGLIMLTKLIKQFNPRSVICCNDIGKCKKRLELFPEYKANRVGTLDEATYENLHWQKERFKELLNYLPVKFIGIDGIEADDIIGYLCKVLKGRKVIISNDRDFIQCIDDETELYLPNKGKMLKMDNIEKFLEFPLEYFLISKALQGDSSDNIKGVKGIGPKTAIRIINKGIEEGNMGINPEWEPIIKMNLSLMNIGLLLDDTDQDKIREQYKMTSKRKVKFKEVKQLLTRLNLKRQASNLGILLQPFKRLK